LPPTTEGVTYPWDCACSHWRKSWTCNRSKRWDSALLFFSGSSQYLRQSSAVLDFRCRTPTARQMPLQQFRFGLHLQTRRVGGLAVTLYRSAFHNLRWLDANAPILLPRFMPHQRCCRDRDAGCPAPPSQIPASGIPAPGSSSQLALAYASRLAPGCRKSSNRWQTLSSFWQGIPSLYFSTMRGRGTWKWASIRLKAGQVILGR
jgi:hypothetical protein